MPLQSQEANKQETVLQSQEADKEENIATTSAGKKSPVHFKHLRLNNCYCNDPFQQSATYYGLL